MDMLNNLTKQATSTTQSLLQSTADMLGDSKKNKITQPISQHAHTLTGGKKKRSKTKTKNRRKHKSKRRRTKSRSKSRSRPKSRSKK